MKRKHATTTLIVLLGIFFLVVPGLVNAESKPMTVGDLQDLCSVSNGSSEIACRFYILGITEGTSLGAKMSKGQSHFCLPEGVSSKAMAATVQKGIAEDLIFFPKDTELLAAGVVAAIMIEKYPCAK